MPDQVTDFACYTAARVNELCGGALSPAVEDDSLAAMRKLVHERGPALEKLAEFGRRRRNLRSNPSHDKSVLAGVSTKETNQLHWEHHYLEYGYRWLSGTVDLQSRARDCAERRIQALFPDILVLGELLDSIRNAAVLTILHELYWKNRSVSHGPKRLPCPWGQYARTGRFAETYPFFVLLQPVFNQEYQSRNIEPYFHAQVGPADCFDAVYLRPLQTIDVADHAWKLDHADFSTFLSKLWTSVVDSDTAERWESVYGADTSMEMILQKHIPSSVACNIPWLTPHPSKYPQSWLSTIDVLSPTKFAEHLPETMCCDNQDADKVLHGLRLFAGPTGIVRLLEDISYCVSGSEYEIEVLWPGRPYGLPGFKAFASIPGL